MQPKTEFTQFELPYRGMYPGAAPEHLAQGYAQSITNFLVNRPGKLVPRGPVNHLEPLATPMAANARIFGGRGWVYGDKIAFSMHDANTLVRQKQYWVGPYRPTTAEANLARAADNAAATALEATLVYDALADTLTIAGLTDTGLGLRGVTAADLKIYGPAYCAPAADIWTIDTGVHYQRRLVRWDGTAFATVAAAPRGVMDVAAHYDRLFCLGGSDPNVPANPPDWDALWYTNPGAAPNAGVASWQTGGVSNKIIVGAERNDFGVALAKVGSDLLVLKRRSVWILRGYSSDTFTVRRVTSELGCVDPRSVVETDDAVYFMSLQGFMRYDGAELTNVSEPVNRTQLLPSVMGLVGDGSPDAGFVEAAPLPDGFILLSVGRMSVVTGGADSRERQYLYDTAAGTWVQFSATAPTNQSAPHCVLRLPRYWLGLGGADIHDMQYVTAPEFATGQYANKSLLVDDQVVDAKYNPQWITRIARLGMPGAKAQLASVQLDARHDFAGNAAKAFSLLLYNGEGTLWTNQFATIRVPAPGDGVRQRYIEERFEELEDLYIEVIATSDVPFTIGLTTWLEVAVHGLSVTWKPAYMRT